MKQQPTLNNYAFIDSQNLNLSIQKMNWKLDFSRFRKYMLDKLQVQKAFIFIGYIPTNEALYTALQQWGFILVFKPTIEQQGVVKGNVDAELVLQAMIEYSNYDKAVIVTGDGDFHCLIEYLEKQNKLAKLIVPNKDRFSSLLRKFSKNILFMNGMKQKLSYKKNERH